MKNIGMGEDEMKAAGLSYHWNSKFGHFLFHFLFHLHIYNHSGVSVF